MASSQKNEKETQTDIVSTESKVTKSAIETQEKVKVEKTSTNAKSVKTEKSIKRKESVYNVEEFVTNAESLFKRKSECVRAALMEKGIEKCTKPEAQKIVEEFMKKEVK